MDDSVTIRRVIELTFAGEDVEVTTVGDGRAAMERIQADPPDIVLADAGTASPDGYEVASFVKSNTALAHIPVLLLSGAFQPIDQARAATSKCDGVLAKPFELQSVIARVKALLQGEEAVAPTGPQALDPPAPATNRAPSDVAEQAAEPCAPDVVVSLQEYLRWLEEQVPQLATTGANPAEAGPDEVREAAGFPFLTGPPNDAASLPKVPVSPFCLDDYFDLVDEVLAGRNRRGHEA
jgi:DNA-binding response OmpR family regulator